MTNNRTLLLYLPTANQKMLPFPPLGIAVLKGYLRRAGKNVSIDDIEMKYWDKDRVIFPVLKPLARKLPLRYNNPKGIFLDTAKVNDYLDLGIPDERMMNILREWEGLLAENPSSFSHVGFSVISVNQLVTSLCFAKYLKEKYGLITILGGNFLTRRMGPLLERYPFIDYVIIDEGEVSLNKLLEGKPLEDIENLLYRSQGKVRINPPPKAYADRMEPDFEGLPFYLYRKEKYVILPYETSKGCRNACAFCITGKKPLYFKDPVMIAEEIGRLKEQHRTSNFIFVDNAINMDWGFSIRLCEEFLKRKLGISWTAYYIPEAAPEGYFRLLKEAGCIQLRLGIENLGEEVLRKMNKRIDFRMVSRTLKESHAAGIWNHLMFMVGHPGERMGDIIKTLGFISAHKNTVKSVLICRFLLSRIERLTRDHSYTSYFGSPAVREYKGFGLSWHEYHDPLLRLKYKLIQSFLCLAGVKSVGMFSRHKERFERDALYYMAFDQSGTKS